MITNKITGKRYVGQTTYSLVNRWNQHKGKNSCCRLLKRSIEKHGAENFDLRIIARCSSMEEMNYRETYYIKIFKTLSPNGYNLNTGGNNRFASDETRAKISASGKGIKKPKSAEHIKKISLSKLGKKQSSAQKQNIAKALYTPVEVPELGIIFESYKKAAEILGTHSHVIRSVVSGKTQNWKGLTFKNGNKESNHHVSSDSELLLNEFLKNKKHGLTGKKISRERIEKSRVRNQKKVFSPELNKVFDSIKIAAQELGLQAAGVGRVCRGESGQTGGYTFKFVKEGVNNVF